MNSKLIDPKTKIVGLDESYKSQVFLEAFDFVTFPSRLISVRGSTLYVQLLLFHFIFDHLF